MGLEATQVSGVASEGVAKAGPTTDAMAPGSGVGSPAAAQQDKTTATQTPADAEKALAEAKAKFQKDLDGLRSSLQSQLSQQQAAFAQREQEYQKRVHELTTAGMDDGERKEYERLRLEQEHQAALDELQQLKQQTAMQQQAQAYAQTFVEMGVDPKKLDYTSIDGLVNSGWAAVREELNALRGQPRSGAPESPKDPSAPKVVTATGVVSSGPSWDDLIKKYGSEEAVYQKVQDGILSPSVIPLPGI